MSAPNICKVMLGHLTQISSHTFVSIISAIRNINSVENAIQPQLFKLPFRKNLTPMQSIVSTVQIFSKEIQIGN